MLRNSLLVLLTTAAVGQADTLDDLAAKALGDKPKPGIGLVVGVLRHGKREVRGCGKVASPRPNRVPDGRTVFEIGSITKTFTGVLLAEAVQRGEMKYDDSIVTHLPPDLRFPTVDDKPPTLLDFATHRSGLPVEPPLLILLTRNADNPYASFDRKLLAETLGGIQPSPAGQTEVYSNLGAGLLGHALGHAAKAESYDRLVRDRITGRLGMTDTAAALDCEQRSRLAVGHNADGEKTAPWDFASLEGCGALRGTADDLLKYAAANLGEGENPPAASLAAALKPRRDSGGSRRLGLFWVHMKLPKSDVEIVWHNGGTGGFRSMMLLCPQHKFAVVVLCNANLGSKIDRLAIDLAASFLPAP